MESSSQSNETGEILRRRSLTDEVYEYLSGKIIAGMYSSGDWLRQDDISTVLGVSQTPVREALDRLVASGLAERVPYRGVRVPILQPGEIVDAFLLRLILETTGARFAASVILPADIQTLDQLIAQSADLDTLEDMPSLRQLNKQFHTHLVEAAGSNLLNKLYEMTTNAFPDWMLYEYMFRHPELLQSSLKSEYIEHKGIVDALRLKDPELASYRVANHIKNLWHDLQTFLDIPQDSIQQIEKQIGEMFPNQHLNQGE
jgi:DNA-binding GntR family transcriptional regulator